MLNFWLDTRFIFNIFTNCTQKDDLSMALNVDFLWMFVSSTGEEKKISIHGMGND